MAAMASMSMSCVSSLSCQLKTLSLPPSSSLTLKPLTFSAHLSHSFFSKGWVSTQRQRSFSIVCEAATQKKADSAAKRARQAEVRRLRNKARKSEVRTRMRKVLEALEGLKKKSDAVPEEIIAIEKLIAEAYSAIDKAVVKGSLHRNTGANRKSRLARNKKAVEIHHGWYAPAPAEMSA